MGFRREPVVNPPVGSTLGADTIRAPLEVVRGDAGGSSNPANESSLSPYRDDAQGKTTTPAGSPPARPPPFTLR